MSETVLLPIDGSDPADAALSFALENLPEAHFVVFHAIDPTDVPYDNSPEAITEEFWSRRVEDARARSEELLSEAEVRVREAGVEATIESETGPPARTILDAADERDVDQIVIGSHGRTGLERVFLGSVAETVLRRSPVPVTVVHGDDE